MKYSIVALLALCVSGAFPSDFEDSFHNELGMELLYPRQTTNTLAAFFSGALGGATASKITSSGNTARPFEVDGDTFPDFSTAAQRACDNQHNTCAELANNKTGTFSVSQCDSQDTQCKSAAAAATATTFANPAVVSSAAPTLFSSNAQFDIFCDA